MEGLRLIERSLLTRQLQRIMETESYWTPDDPYYHELSAEETFDPRDVNAHVEQDQVVIHCDNPEETLSGVSGDLRSHGGIRYPLNRVSNFRHDFVAQGLSIHHTDDRLDVHYPPAHDGCDNMTPDYIFDSNVVPHCKIIVELATTRSRNVDTRSYIYKDKIDKYDPPIRQRSTQQRKTILTCVVVGPNFYYSSCPLPTELAIDLCFRFRVACICSDQLNAMGVSTDMYDEQISNSQEMKAIIASLEGITREGLINVGDSLLQMDSEDLARIISPITEREKKHVATVIQAELDRIKSNPPDPPKGPEEAKKFFDKCKKPTNWGDKIIERRFDKKPVLPIPIFEPRVSEDPSIDIGDYLPLPNDNMTEDEKAVLQCWRGAFEFVPNWEVSHESPELLLQEAYEMDPEKSEQYRADRKAHMNKYHRVKLSTLTHDDKYQLAEDGVWAKKLKSDPKHRHREDMQKRAFDITTDVRDIDAFLKDTFLYEESSQKVPKSTSMFKDLVHRSLNLVTSGGEYGGKSNDEIRGLLEQLTSTKGFLWLDMVSDIFTEVVASNKQHCKSGQMILKKLRYYDIYLLILPTRSSEHLFFSIFNPGPLVSQPGEEARTVGRSWIPHYTGFVTHFMSVKPWRLFNLVSMSPFYLSNSAYWAWHYKLEDKSPKGLRESKEALMMSQLAMLIRLEDKAKTEESVTISRYMFMEMFKSRQLEQLENMGLISRPNPLKMISKMDTCQRSRLVIWIQRSLIFGFMRMMKNSPPRPAKKSTFVDSLEKDDVRVLDDHALDGKMDEEGLSEAKDAWINLYNPYTGGHIDTASKAVGIMYLGYYKNKNEMAEENVSWKLVEKILEEEFKYDPKNADKCNGKAEPEVLKPGPHEFSPAMLKMSSDMLAAELKRVYSDKWKDVVGRKVLQKLWAHTTEHLATMKASANIDLEKMNTEKARLDSDFASRRKKVLEALSEAIDIMQQNPFMNLHSIILKIESTSAGVVADLFKKAQHGGLREIYVLEIHCRIIQLFLETIGRVLCSEFKQETLTHPKGKLSTFDDHRKKLAGSLNLARGDADSMRSLSFFSSCDKTRWNQNLVMPALAYPLLRLTPKFLHVPIVRCLNLWTNKKIKLPQSVVNMLLSSTMLDNEVFKKFKDIYNKGKDDREDRHKLLLRHQWDPYITLQTGMMQGILHYCSSLLHVGFLQFFEHFTRQELSKMLPRCKFLVDSVCSSDDSAFAISVIYDAEPLVRWFNKYRQERKLPDTEQAREFKMVLKAIVLTSRWSEWANNMSRYFNMIPSIKDTLSLLDCVEFNSEFMFHNTLCTPTLKFSSGCLVMAESEDFMDRFNMFHNLLSELKTSGMTSLSLMMHNCAQALLHYKSLGLSMSPVFSYWSRQVTTCPDPTLGFFLLENPLLPCVLGFNFTHYLAFKNGGLLRVSARSCMMSGMFITEDGAIYQSFRSKPGNHQRWKAMIEKVSGDLDVEEIIEEKPYLLFQDATSLFESQVKLGMKVRLPGIGNSLTHGDQFIKAMEMSLYILWSKALTSVKLHGEAPKLERKVTKHSLLSYTRELVSKTVERQLPYDGNKEDLAELMMFPQKELFEDMILVLTRVESYIPVPCRPLRSVKSQVRMLADTFRLPEPMFKSCARQWFDMRSNVSHSVHRRCWDAYSYRVPWLRDSFSETMAAAGFESPIELYNFISKQEVKRRAFFFVGPPLQHASTEEQLTRMCTLHWDYDKRLKPLEGTVEAPETLTKFRDVMTSVALATTYPSEDPHSAAIGVLRQSPSLMPSGGSVSGMRPRVAQLAIVQQYVKGRLTPEELFDYLQQINSGILINYIVPQKREEDLEGNVKWTGYGRLHIHIGRDPIVVEAMDQEITLIKVKDGRTIVNNERVLVDIFKAQGLSPQSGAKGRQIVISGRYLGKWNGHRLCSQRETGTLVLEDELREVTKPENMKFMVGVTREGLKLSSVEGRQKGREYPVLHLKPYDQDMVIKPTTNTYKTAEMTWMKQAEMNGTKALSQLSKIVENWEKADCLENDDALFKREVDDEVRIRMKKYERTRRRQGLGTLNEDHRQKKERQFYAEEALSLRKKMSFWNHQFMWLRESLISRLGFRGLIEVSKKYACEFVKQDPAVVPLSDETRQLISDVIQYQDQEAAAGFMDFFYGDASDDSEDSDSDSEDSDQDHDFDFLNPIKVYDPADVMGPEDADVEQMLDALEVETVISEKKKGDNTKTIVERHQYWDGFIHLAKAIEHDIFLMASRGHYKGSRPGDVLRLLCIIFGTEKMLKSKKTLDDILQEVKRQEAEGSSEEGSDSEDEDITVEDVEGSDQRSVTPLSLPEDGDHGAPWSEAGLSQQEGSIYTGHQYQGLDSPDERTSLPSSREGERTGEGLLPCADTGMEESKVSTSVVRFSSSTEHESRSGAVLAEEDSEDSYVTVRVTQSTEHWRSMKGSESGPSGVCGAAQRKDSGSSLFMPSWDRGLDREGVLDPDLSDLNRLAVGERDYESEFGKTDRACEEELNMSLALSQGPDYSHHESEGLQTQRSEPPMAPLRRDVLGISCTSGSSLMAQISRRTHQSVVGEHLASSAPCEVHEVAPSGVWTRFGNILRRLESDDTANEGRVEPRRSSQNQEEKDGKE